MPEHTYDGSRDLPCENAPACGDTQEDNLAVCAELPVLRTLCGADRHDYPGDILQHRSVLTACVGFAAALIAALFNRGLLIVALSACGGVLAAELVMQFLIK